MPKIEKVFTLEVSVEQFLNTCSPLELKEIEMLILSPRFQNKMKQQEKEPEQGPEKKMNDKTIYPLPNYEEWLRSYLCEIKNRSFPGFIKPGDPVFKEDELIHNHLLDEDDKRNPGYERVIYAIYKSTTHLLNTSPVCAYGTIEEVEEAIERLSKETGQNYYFQETLLY